MVRGGWPPDGDEIYLLSPDAGAKPGQRVKVIQQDKLVFIQGLQAD